MNRDSTSCEVFGPERDELERVVKHADSSAALKLCRKLHESLESSDIEISVVAPVFNEARAIQQFYERVSAVMEELEVDYELVLVNDGSSDATPSLLDQLVEADPRVVVVELTRNFGHQRAISAGIDWARGNAIVVIDADLQDPPELIATFIEKWRAGNEVVYGVRRSRRENPLLKLCYLLFYRILRLFSDIQIPLDAGDFCLLDARAVRALRAMPERNRFLRGLRSWIGFAQCAVEYDRDSRVEGRSKYTLTKLFTLALDGLISFSYSPLRAISVLGFFISVSAFGMALFYFVKKVSFGLNPPGFATIVVAVFFLSGVQLVTLGILGEYLARAYEELKQRPLYLVSRIISQKSLTSE